MTTTTPKTVSRAPQFRPGELLVKTRKEADSATLENYGTKVVERFDFDPEHFPDFEGELYRVSLPEGWTVSQGIARLAQDPKIEYAAPNQILSLEEARVPNDLDQKLYGLHNEGQSWGTDDADIDAPEAWTIQSGSSSGPIVAVIDTGVDITHPDLKSNIWSNPNEILDGKDNDGNGVIDDLHGYNALDNSGDCSDAGSHGTHVAGTLAAEGNNGEGVVGVNWQAQIMPIRIYDEDEKTTIDAIIRGVVYATKMGARVTSNSYGGGGAKNLALEDAFRHSPALHVASAGNDRQDNDETPHYPSGYDLPNMISVGRHQPKR